MSYGSGAYGYTAYAVDDDGTITINEGMGMLAMPTFVSIQTVDDELISIAEAFAGAGLTLADMVAYVATMEDSKIWAIIETLNAADTVFPIGYYQKLIAESMLVNAKLTPILLADLSETIAMADMAIDDVRRLVAIMDGIALADGLGVSVVSRLSEAMTLQTLIRMVQNGQLNETVNLAELVTAIQSSFISIFETALLSDVANGMAMVSMLMSESMVFDDSTISLGIYKETLAEGLGFSVSFVIDGVPYVGLCMNTVSHGITEYTNYNFNALATFKGVLYGTNDDGLFRLDGNTDNGTLIDAYGRLPLARIAGGKQARVDCAYLGYRSDGTLQLKATISDPTGNKVSHVYDMPSQPSDATRSQRVKLGRGLKSAYWGFELINTNGSDFAVDIIEIHPLSLDRRIQ